MGVMVSFYQNLLGKIRTQPLQMGLDSFALYFSSKLRSADAKAMIISKCICGYTLEYNIDREKHIIIKFYQCQLI